MEFILPHDLDREYRTLHDKGYRDYCKDISTSNTTYTVGEVDRNTCISDPNKGPVYQFNDTNAILKILKKSVNEAVSEIVRNIAEKTRKGIYNDIYFEIIGKLEKADNGSYSNIKAKGWALKAVDSDYIEYTPQALSLVCVNTETKKHVGYFIPKYTVLKHKLFGNNGLFGENLDKALMAEFDIAAAIAQGKLNLKVANSESRKFKDLIEWVIITEYPGYYTVGITVSKKLIEKKLEFKIFRHSSTT